MAGDQAETARGFRVHGRVQGVGFRWWTRRTARSLGLDGSVRNLRDGSVEVRASGSADAIRRLENLLQRGPASANVLRVEPFEIEPATGDGFTIEP